MFKWEDNFEYDGRLQIAGTFSNWQPVSMSRAGDSHEFTIVLGMLLSVCLTSFIDCLAPTDALRRTAPGSVLL